MAPLSGATGGDSRRLGADGAVPRVLGVRTSETFRGDDWIGLKMRQATRGARHRRAAGVRRHARPVAADRQPRGDVGARGALAVFSVIAGLDPGNPRLAVPVTRIERVSHEIRDGSWRQASVPGFRFALSGLRRKTWMARMKRAMTKNLSQRVIRRDDIARTRRRSRPPPCRACRAKSRFQIPRIQPHDTPRKYPASRRRPRRVRRRAAARP